MNDIDKKQLQHHLKHYQDILDKGDLDGFINPDSFWYFTHVHCLQHIQDFFEKIPKSSFLTVADGYCGREGGFVKRFGHYVHASDIQPCLIEIAKNKGLVDECSTQDMTNLQFKDESFDFVLCKESLHHLSMPYKGLYEMFRVAKKGVILIEPNEDGGYKQYRYNKFEEVGNYMCSFSSHELIKAGIAYGYKFFVVTYSIVFFSFLNMNNVNAGKFEEERVRLLQFDKGYSNISDKPLLIVFFLRDEEYLNMFQDSKYKKISIEGVI